MNELNPFIQFFSENRLQFIRFAQSYTHDASIAEDIVMEAMMKYWENRHDLPVDTNLPAYVLTIVKNKALNYLRHLQYMDEASEYLSSHSKWEISNRIATLEACNPESLFTDEIRQIVKEVLAELPPITARIFTLSREENKSYKEIAEITELTVKGVEYHMGKAIQTLRTALKDYLIFIPFLYKLLA